MANADIQAIMDFLPCQTPKQWLDAAIKQQSILLIDHAHCEKKAALSAIHFIHRYPDREKLVYQASRLAREELRHFEKVLALLQKKAITMTALSPSRYAAGLRRHVSPQEPQRLIDLLIIAAFIEARSCERFYQLYPRLDQELATFYHGLFAAEARHFQLYLNLATEYAHDDLQARVDFFAEQEKHLIQSEDKVFRFHSGAYNMS
ncbi:MAG: tRNA-(ms[2]io[6]A)-hydroxylase [Pseudomonadota bacterium]